jgi:small subunit ribosomal protein S12e
MDEDIHETVRKVVQACYHQLALAKGLHEVCKALEAKKAKLCLLAEDCDHKDYKKLVQILAKKAGVPIVKIDSKMKLGEYVGRCKYDDQMTARKVRKCSSAVLTDYPEMVKDDAKKLEDYAKSH